MQRFARSIASHDADEVPCAEARTRLDSHASGPELHSHLRQCPACAEQAAAWQHIQALQAAGALAEPPRYPVFDLSFLPQPHIADVWTQVRAGLRRLSYDIPAAVALVGQTLLSPPAGLTVSYAHVQAARRAAHPKKENLVSLSVDDQPQNVRISLNVSEAASARWLAVSMRLLSSGQALSNERIALCNEQGQAQEIKTVRPGETEARFPDIPAGRYLVRVEYSGKTWELPLSL
jgi:hypothetical protein